MIHTCSSWIAALNAVSDLHAHERPTVLDGLAIATLPYARGPVQEAQLYELLAGAVESFRQLGVVLTGGHTTEGSELALGFAVTGFTEEDRLFRKSNLRPGDRLILTKPLGTGALLAAWMRGECRAAWFEELLAVMLLPNAAAAGVFAAAGGDRVHGRDRFRPGRPSAGNAGRQPGCRSFARSGRSAVRGLHRGGEPGHCPVRCTATTPRWPAASRERRRRPPG